VNVDNVACFAGAEEAIYSSVKTLLEPTDHMIVVTPCYQSSISIAESIVGVNNVTPVPLDSNFNWNFNLLNIQKAIRPFCTKLLFINFPHNPTGSTITKQMLLDIVTLAKYYDIWVICDEVYRGVETFANNGESLPAIATLYTKGISIGGLAKPYGLPGLRIGWICMPFTKKNEVNNEIFNAIADFKHYLSICNSAPSELLGVIALQNSAIILNNNKRIIQQNIEYFEQFMLKYSKLFHWHGKHIIAGVTTFVQLLSDKVPMKRLRSNGTVVVEPSIGTEVNPLSNTNSLTVEEFAHILVTKYNILILPGESFYNGHQHENMDDIGHQSEDHYVIPTIDTSSYFRIGFGRLNFIENMKLFEIAIQEIFA